jgi:hypothetical protein
MDLRGGISVSQLGGLPAIRQLVILGEERAPIAASRLKARLVLDGIDSVEVHMSVCWSDNKAKTFYSA